MTMVVQHLDNRLSLNSINPSEQLHEFQIVHALITCRKQAFVEENARNTSNSHENESQSLDSISVRRKGNKETSFVTTIRQTFNALAQATNPSLHAKHNVTGHPVSIASTVKNIISQFSRQAYHGPISCASPSQSATPKLNSSPTRRDGSTRKKVSSEKEPNLNNETSQPRLLQPASSTSPSTSNGPTVECTQIKTAVIRQSNLNTIATKPKTTSVRARNAHRLIRHESAPIPPPDGVQGAVKKPAASVRRSKSDAVCYTSHMRQSRRKIESNVQTKVLHFENCCKGKGQASMCLECRKHSLEESLPSSSARNSPTLPKIESIKPRQENYVGALSYHRPSIITQSQNASAVSSNSGAPSVISLPKISHKKTPLPTATRSKAVVCPGGTFFGSTTLPKPIPNVSHGGPSNPAAEIPAHNIETKNVASTSKECSSNVPQCSQMKRKHSQSEDEPMQNKRGIKENDVTGNTATDEQEPCRVRLGDPTEPEGFETPTLNLPSCVEIELSNEDMCGARGVKDSSAIAGASQNLFSRLSNFDKSPEGSSKDSKITNVEVSQLPLDYDSSDNMDSSSSSSGETAALSPRQDYLARSSRRSTSLRRIPSTRYQRMRRKLKKLITRSRSCSEVVQPVVQTQSEVEANFLQSLRIPTPLFMLSKDSFSAKRQQLAMHFNTQQNDYMSRLPDHTVVQIFSHLDTRSLARLKCVCQDFRFLIDSYDIRGTDSLWVEDKRYIDDPCKFCRKRFTAGDVSMCQYHAKLYHCDLPYGRSYWMCCFQIERSAPGCRTGIHNNYWRAVPSSPSKG